VTSTVKAIISNGGKIVQPIGADAPEITTRYSDPAGNIFGLYQESGNAADARRIFINNATN
jgi:predicted enzyme related to lactoylglutathione lyase